MFNTCHYVFLLPLFLFILMPLHAMETNSSDNTLTEFFHAIKKCDVQTVRILLKNNPDFIHTLSPAGTTALEEAIQIDFYSMQTNVQRPELVELLLKSGAHIEDKYLIQLLIDIRGHDICKNRVAHLLFCFGAPMDSDDSQDYENDPANILKMWEREEASQIINNKELTKIIHAHICTRLYKAIKSGDANEVRRLIKKYKLDINKPLPCYDIMLDYDTPSAIADARKDLRATQSPLTYAKEHNQDAITNLLILEFGADPNPNINEDYARSIFFEDTTSIDWVYINENTETETNEICIENAETDYILAFSEEVDPINWFYTQEALDEKTTENTEHIQRLSEPIDPIILTYPYENPENRLENPVQSIENKPILNNSEPNPTNKPSFVITNSKLPWKWIGGGLTVVVIGIVTKKLYNWWQTKAEPQETEDMSAPQNGQIPLVDIHA